MSQNANMTTSQCPRQMVATGPSNPSHTCHPPLNPNPSGYIHPVFGPVTSTPNLLRKAPVEILQQILSFLPDIDSVANARISSQQLNEAFLGFESEILEMVLYSELGDLTNLHPEAARALQIPVNSTIAKDLTELVSAFHNQDNPARPPRWRDDLSFHGHAATEIRRLMMQGAPTQPEEENRDPAKGPYTISRALEIAQVHKAHQKLTNTFFETLAASTTSPCRESFEVALWHFEQFCRTFGSELFYERWGPSVCFVPIIETYWEGFTDAEAKVMGKVHGFLSKLVLEAFKGVSTHEEGPCPHVEPSGALRCRSCTERGVEGAISMGLVGILDQVSDSSTALQREHPFFLGAFLRHNFG